MQLIPSVFLKYRPPLIILFKIILSTWRFITPHANGQIPFMTHDFNKSREAKLSKILSFILRHKPSTIGLALDSQGWASIEELLAKIGTSKIRISREELLKIVANSEKARFTISEDNLRIRAAQGHSVPVDLGLQPQAPPSVLFHGTAMHLLNSILSEGLKPKARQQVHLSTDEATAHRVGQRHGKPFIFKIEALRMHAKGFKFYIADNGVWLTDQVPPEFLAPSSSTADSATTSRQPKLST